MVYVPVYNPWAVYGTPFPPFPGYYYYPPPGIFFGGLAIGFGIGIGIGLFAHWGWGWGHWGMGWGPRWGGRGVFYNHNTYITRSTTVINRGFSRPGGPGRGFGARGAYARPLGDSITGLVSTGPVWATAALIATTVAPIAPGQAAVTHVPAATLHGRAVC